MISRRSVISAMAAALSLSLAGCLMDDKALAPLPDDTKAELTKKGLKLGSAMFVRIFKLDNVMEVWLRNPADDYVLFRTYPLCNWSGDIGPKTTQGDKQAPEGFYVVTARQMNPESKFYLSFNIGYPNEYDAAKGYTGGELMVHGGCRSAGCYAITDDAIQELFTLAREAFTAGQRRFPVHAFPFRMTEANMEFRKNDKNYPFWANLKQGYDIFENTHRVPVVGVQSGQYVFFGDEQSVPAEFKSASVGIASPKLISGW